VTSAGVNALMLASQLLVDPGDHVVEVVPLWPNLQEIPKILGARVTTVALDFSRDAAQAFMFVVNQNNSQIDIVDRQSGKLLSSLGEIGNLPGQFNQAHSVAVDSRNNLYVVENRGRRIHKFKPVGQ
jgi:hypothetical protein